MRPFKTVLFKHVFPIKDKSLKSRKEKIAIVLLKVSFEQFLDI
jgi:hypothetical protein